ncbi:PEP-CTERM sorting domain-containing protein [Sphingomonas elodea]|uniref:PEP-CTERM sorting domain-containing protein n=1 Tax=Sphingomonas elodea TaxID=179878 RepID=UPI0002630DCE|nr:PEP-CTERM sorting domain-containing protein [Sphingomonas elodea]
MKHWIFAAILCAATLGSANAATVTRSFNVSASQFTNFFNKPTPFKTFSADITVTYDTSQSGFYGAPDFLRIVTDGQVNAGPFSATPIAGYFPPNGISKTGRIGVGGAINGGNVLLANSDDFYIVFDVEDIRFASISFDSTAQPGAFLSTDAVVRETTGVSAVPEAGTWLMLLAGSALAGGAVRRKRPQLARG